MTEAAGVAATELALLAGADRVEGTLFGNGERTGNVDILNIAYNMFSQGINPELDIENVREIADVYERCTKMDMIRKTSICRQAGIYCILRFSSGCHQQGYAGSAMRETASTGKFHICRSIPADIGREYEPIVRINSQSGKGGVAFVMDTLLWFQTAEG